MQGEKGRNITVWLSGHDLKSLQALAENRGDTISGLLRAAAQRLETQAPIIQSIEALEKRLITRIESLVVVAAEPSK